MVNISFIEILFDFIQTITKFITCALIAALASGKANFRNDFRQIFYLVASIYLCLFIWGIWQIIQKLLNFWLKMFYWKICKWHITIIILVIYTYYLEWKKIYLWFLSLFFAVYTLAQCFYTITHRIPTFWLDFNQIVGIIIIWWYNIFVAGNCKDGIIRN